MNHAETIVQTANNSNGAATTGNWYISLGDLPAGPGARNIVIGGEQRALRLHGQPDPAFLSTASRAACGVVFEGTLYNGPELLAGHERPATTTPAEVILSAYLRWGPGALNKIKGTFACIIWDSKGDVLYAVRDPLGIYPLFYADTVHEFLASTSIEALLQHRRLSAKINRGVVVNYLRHRWPSPKETFYEYIQRVPPGHMMRLEPSSCRVYRYWDPAPPGEPVRWLDDDEVEQRFSQLLNQAIDRFLGIGPAGIFLSGGLDSVSVAALTREASRSRGMPDPWALSLVFPHPDVNEKETQVGVAASLGLPQVLLDFDEAIGQGLLPASLHMSSTWPAPLQNVWNPAYYRLALEGKERGCRVILSGGGGDEWLTVDPIFAADLLRSLKISEFLQLVVNIKRSYRLPLLPMMHSVLWKHALLPVLKAQGRKVLRRVAPGVLRERQRRRQGEYAPSWLIPVDPFHDSVDEQETSIPPYEEADSFYIGQARQFLEHPLVSLELEEVFETGRRTGLRMRMPYWDAELADLLFRTPPSILNKGGRSKGLVRHMLYEKFPTLGFERQKKVISLDFFRIQVLRDAAKAWQATGGIQALADLGLVDAQRLDSTVNEIVTCNQVLNAHVIWETMNVEAWLRPRL